MDKTFLIFFAWPQPLASTAGSQPALSVRITPGNLVDTPMPGLRPETWI